MTIYYLTIDEEITIEAPEILEAYMESIEDDDYAN